MEKYEFNRCVGEFIKFLERNYYSNDTVDGYKKDLYFFRNYIVKTLQKDHFLMTEITKDKLLSFMDYGRHIGHRVNTIARRISTLKSFYKFLCYEKDYKEDTAGMIRVPKTYIPLPTILSEKEVDKLLISAETLDLKYRLLFSVMYFTGSRLTAARMIKRENISLERGFLYFSKIKGGRDLYVPLHSQLKIIFERYFHQNDVYKGEYIFKSSKLKGRPVSASDVRKKLKIAAKMAGIQNCVTPHLLRHCTATHLTINQVPQIEIASILGHADLRSTMRYQHLSVEHLRGAIDTL